jgi:hypothetical protein
LTTRKPKTGMDSHCEDSVLKLKETGVSKETTTLKGTNKE